MISILFLERIAKKNGIRRISKDALEELRDMLDEEGSNLAHKAVKLSMHARRRTVMEDDIKLAAGRKE
ncbi:MAG: NFYB/HAP3 family transcription factor subunit [Candidatus Aenigmarchaeota archaeon]|nr:NFYB/HAP3 family transcription factor subunit [Candidatus Aenigmarchaeota archaeon]